jgi:hypothetical protein
MEELTGSSSSFDMLPAAVSEVLGVSLSEVRDRYFGPSNTSSDMDQMLAEERFSLREDLQEQERFVENTWREWEAELKSYQEDVEF